MCFMLGNLWISEPSLSIQFQQNLAFPNIKYNWVLLFLWQMFWVIIYGVRYIFSLTNKTEQFEFSELPSVCTINMHPGGDRLLSYKHICTFVKHSSNIPEFRFKILTECPSVPKLVWFFDRMGRSAYCRCVTILLFSQGNHHLTIQGSVILWPCLLKSGR